MSDVLERLQSIDTAENLATTISEVMPDLYELYSSGWETLNAKRDSIDKFITFKHSLISRLDFQNQGNRAFIMICLDFAQRLNLQASIPHLMRIVNHHHEHIHLNKRLTAGNSFIYPRPHTAEDILDKYPQICSLLQDAINTEEDNNKNSIITFLSYYSSAVDQLSPVFADDLKGRIQSSLLNSEYPFLNEIPGLNEIEARNPKIAQDQIQAIIDAIINESIAQSRPCPTDEFIIEENTPYSIALQNVSCNFHSIKSLSDARASGNSIPGRGVMQIRNEQELFDYMRNYGNMHQAKVKSALAFPFPQQFDNHISLIDWGCGQGLASMVFMDKFGTEKIKQIILIEPSELALRRAALHCKKYAPDVPLQTICKEFDELSTEDIHLVDPETTVHLFSNVLDMESYSVDHMVNTVRPMLEGLNYFICISPYIDDIRTGKINTFIEKIGNERASFTMINTENNTYDSDYWNCNNMARGRTTHHGGCQFCGDFSGLPCGNRWTRVLRVFKI